MASTEQGKPGTGDTKARSENLLPADDAGDGGRFDVAEEVNLDQQSDSARRVGQAGSGTAQDEARDATRRP